MIDNNNEQETKQWEVALDESEPQKLSKQYKSGEINKEFYQSKLQVWHSSQLDVFIYGLSKKEKIAKAEIDRESEKFLAIMNSNYIERMSEIGKEHSDAVSKGLIRLTDKITEDIGKMNKNWPKEFRENYLQSIQRGYKVFYNIINTSIDSIGR